MRILLISFGLFCSSILSNAQTLKGRVLDSDSKEPIEYAVVKWFGTSVGTLTNDMGEFQIERVQQTDSLQINFVGYSSGGLHINNQDFIDVYLVPYPDPKAIVIVGDQTSTRIQSLNPQAFQVMGEKELCKAACCSLSESFETNASVDASFTDAITGTRQIKMLGLDGRYTQVLFDNIPSARGLASIYGLSYLPGPWVNEISISKGAGSITSGYESITGQINVAIKSREMKERAFVNAYSGSQGRYEFNGAWRQKVGKSWSSMLLTHASMAQRRFDMNKDGFLDNPLFKNAIIRNEWSLRPQNGGWRGEYSLTASTHENISGQYNYDPKSEIANTLWGANSHSNRAEATAKTGYVFNASGDKSFGSQISGVYQNQTGHYGNSTFNREYQGTQASGRINLLLSTKINKVIKQTSGLSFVFDQIKERLGHVNFNRTERVSGIFTEWNANFKERLQVIVGARIDYNNYYGMIYTPRLHARYSISDKTTIKISAGRGFKSPNIIMDNVGMLASNRTIEIANPNAEWIFGMPMERADNYGVVLTHKFKLNYREAFVTLDAYYTNFLNQIVADWETPGKISFYSLSGKSYSQGAQLEMGWSPIKRLDLRVAHRWIEAKTQYSSGFQYRPLIGKNRFFFNVAYETRATDKGRKWVFDFTARWMDKQRLPNSRVEGTEQLPSWTKPYWILNAQVAFHFNDAIELYVGGENLTNYFITNPIVYSNQATSQYFDASQLWGPVFGRMGYVGLRWRIK
jgi:outer membrane receptor for ferrienterochelin and colicins